TSGTTGKPKATMHFHRDVLAIADTFARHILRSTPDDLFAASPPLAFTFGLGQSVVFPLRAGAAAFLLEQPSPPRLLEAVERHGVTVLATAPTGYRAMVPDLRAAHLKSLRACVSAGETLPKATWEAVHDACGLSVIDGIGSTEMLHIFISAAGDEIRPGSTGRAVPGYVAKVQDPDGMPVRDVAVIGAADEERGMIVKAVVVLQPGAELGPEPAKTLQDFVKSQIAPYKYPRAIEFADALPRTATGKLQRFRLRAPT